ncbi:PRDM1-like protein [Mya arenaria]|uniref:PRDM1-like protein n=1 Tax=Mya arenaria TaxID=6604 RepID=A0ABY7F2V0_MYAAR|nr:PRDM1-like protein [Mya arenaria]
MLMLIHRDSESAALEVQPGSTLAELAQLSGSGRQCGVCGRQFSTRQNLERHLILHTGQRPFKCETCGRRFTQVSHLKSHKLVHMRRVIAGMEDRI